MDEKIKKILEHYTYAHQIRKHIEEVLEMQEAIDIYLMDVYDKKENEEHLKEEISDYFITRKQIDMVAKNMMYEIGATEEEIEEIMEYKVNRHLKRIEGESNDGKS